MKENICRGPGMGLCSLFTSKIFLKIIGLKALTYLTEEAWNALKRYYVNLRSDLNVVSRYLSWQNFNILMEMSYIVANRARVKEDQLKSGLSKLLTDL